MADQLLDGELVVHDDCGTCSVNDVTGRGLTFLRTTGSKRIARKDGDGDVLFNGQPPIVGTKNGNGRIRREP